MGKRKSRKLQTKAAAPKCDTVFDCPYCSHRQTIEVKLERKAGLGKLHCRICGYKYQRRLGPLDKEVDIYCAMIDDAEAANSRKQNDGIGFLARDDDKDDNEDLADVLGGKSESELLSSALNNNSSRKALEAALYSDDEEDKNDDGNPEQQPADYHRRKASDPFSASQKIAEMGLGKTASEALPAARKGSDARDFKAIMSETAGGAAALNNVDSDSDSLF